MKISEVYVYAKYMLHVVLAVDVLCRKLPLNERELSYQKRIMDPTCK